MVKKEFEYSAVLFAGVKEAFAPQAFCALAAIANSHVIITEVRALHIGAAKIIIRVWIVNMGRILWSG